MPSYNFHDKKTDRTETLEMSISEMEEKLRSNPELELHILVAPAYADPFQLGRMRPDGAFRERMDKIKRQNPGNTIDGTLT